MNNSIHLAPPVKIRWAIFISLALVALAIRLPQLGERPMHTDEAVNAYLTGQLLAGEKYHYDPVDRHGPALTELALPLVRLQGTTNYANLTETQLRLTPVIVGSATILLFGAAVEMLGFIPCLVAALLFAFGALPVYYSRYFIHETLFVAATFGLILAGGWTVKTHSLRAAVLAGFCAAFMLACKETAVIHFFALGLAGIVGWKFNSQTHLPPPRIWLTAAFAFVISGILLFTWGGQNWAALADLIRAIPHLADRAAGQGHAKPFGDYGLLLDPLFVYSLVAAAGIYGVLCDAVARVRPAGLLVAIYALVIFLAYSLIPYKTPWLALNLWLPLVLLCGLGVDGVWMQIQNPTGRWVAGLAIAALVWVAAQQTQTLVFAYPADEKNPYAYAHTTEDVLGLPRRIAELAQQQQLAQPRIAVVATDAWPLPWYLRKFSQVDYWQPGQAMGQADFIITTTDVSGALAERLKSFRPEYFGVRPNVLLILWSPPLPETVVQTPTRQP